MRATTLKGERYDGGDERNFGRLKAGKRTEKADRSKAPEALLCERKEISRKPAAECDTRLNVWGKFKPKYWDMLLRISKHRRGTYG